jgi:hypothetical protein
MFAEDIGGWLVAGALLFGGLGATGIALCAIIPAWRGRLLLTLALVSPALLMVVLTTCYLAQSYFRRADHNREEIIDNYVQPWFFMAFLPLITSVVVLSIASYKRKKLAHPSEQR